MAGQHLVQEDLKRIMSGNLPETLLPVSTDLLIDLCERWSLLSGFQRQHIIERVWPGSYLPAFSHALAATHLTGLTDCKNGMRRLSDDRMREVIRILQGEDLSQFM